MSNYTKATNFATKDTLPTGDSGKIVKGTEIDTEFNAIASAVATKADIASPTFTGTPAAPTATSGTNTTQVATTAFVTGAVTTERTTAATLTNKTITSPVINEIIHEGTADDFETTLAFTDPTADRTITFPDKAGTVAMTSELPSATALFTSSGTYAIAGSTTLTVTATAHGRAVDDVVYLNFTSGTAVDDYYTIVTVPTANTFTVTHGTSITSSGNVTGYYSNLGLISIASVEETTVGTNTDKAVTPAGVDAAIEAKFNITGSAPIYGARAWVNFDCTRDSSGSTNSDNTERFIRGSGNITSVVKDESGIYTINFDVDMPDANYAINVSCMGADDVVMVWSNSETGTYTASAFQVKFGDSNGPSATQNPSHAWVTVFR
jgi:hypothetical protein